MARKKSGSPPNEIKAADYRYTADKRKNIPPAKMAGEGTVPVVPKAKYAFSPHLFPALRFDATGETDQFARLVDVAGTRPLSSEELAKLQLILQVREPTL